MFVLHVISEWFLILYSSEFIPPTIHVSDTGFSQKLKIKYIIHLPDEQILIGLILSFGKGKNIPR